MGAIGDKIVRAYKEWNRLDPRSNNKRKFAKYLGISPPYMSDLLNGFRRWNNEELLAKALGFFDLHISSQKEQAEIDNRKPLHEDLHQKLQTILNAGPDAENVIQWNVEAVYDRVMRGSVHVPVEREPSSARVRKSRPAGKKQQA